MSEQEKKKTSGKKSKRSRERWPALKPELNLKTRFELFDQDYVNKLTPAEKDWLNSFNEEWNNANFKHKGDNLQTKDEHRKESYGRNNARNRCIWTRAKASGMSSSIEDLKDYQLYDGMGVSEEDKMHALLKEREHARNSGSDGTDDEDET